MPELRQDPITKRWVIIASERAHRPRQQSVIDAASNAKLCPFCAGHEEMTPPQTLVLPEQGDWRVRVVPNLYPALERQEVVVHSRRHARSIAELEGDEPELVVEAWQRRAATVRGYVHFGLLTFIPLFEHDARDTSSEYGSRVLALMLFAGAVGTLVVGPLADRHGRRLMLTLTFATAVPGVALYLANPGALGLAGIAFAGAGIISTFGLVYSPDPLAVASELGRVTKAGGRLAITAWRPTPA